MPRVKCLIPLGGEITHPDLDLSQDFLLETALVGKKRSGPKKQFVFLLNGLAIKGPYPQLPGHRDINRSRNIIRISEFLSGRSKYVVIAMAEAMVGSSVYILFPNLYQNLELGRIPYTEPDTGLSYNIAQLPGNEFITANEYLKDLINRELFYRVWLKDLIYDYLLLYVLGTGDVNLCNTLIRNEDGRPFIVDIDEDRTKSLKKDLESLSATFYLSRAPASSLDWISNAIPLYSELADKLEAEPIDEGLHASRFGTYRERQAAAAKILRSFDQAQNQIGAGLNKISKPSIPETPSRINIPILVGGPTRNEDESVKKYVDNRGDMLEYPPDDNNKGQVTTSAEPNLKLYTVKVLKSALETYIQRSEFEKACMVAAELWNTSKATLTTLIRMLGLIAVEDISLSAVDLVSTAVTLSLEWQSKKPDFAQIVTLIQYLSQSQKTRVVSHIRSAFVDPKGRQLALEAGLPISNTFPNVSQSQAINSVFHPQDDRNLVDYAKAYYISLIQYDPNCLAWLSGYMDYTTKNKIKITPRAGSRGVTNPAYILFRILGIVLENDEFVVPLEKSYLKGGKSRDIFLYYPTCVKLFQLTTLPALSFDSYAVQYWRNSSFVSDLQTGRYELILGVQNNKDYLARNNSVVVPEDEQFKIPLLQDIYLAAEDKS